MKNDFWEGYVKPLMSGTRFYWILGGAILFATFLYYWFSMFMYSSPLEVETYGEGEYFYAGAEIEQTVYPVRDVRSNKPSSGRMLRQEVYVDTYVEDIAEFNNVLSLWSERNGAILINSNISMASDREIGTVRIRISPKKWDSLKKTIEGNSIQIVSIDFYGDDITDSYSDITRQLAILEKTRTRLLRILDSTSDQDVLMKTVGMLQDIESQIAMYQNLLNNSKVQSSTVLVEVTFSTNRFSEPFFKTSSWNIITVVNSAVDGLKIFIRFLVTLIVWLLVFSPVWGSIIWGLAWVYRRNK